MRISSEVGVCRARGAQAPGLISARGPPAAVLGFLSCRRIYTLSAYFCFFGLPGPRRVVFARFS